MADVLIVEDDKFLSKIYATKLKKEGIDVEMAFDGEQGLSKMRANKPKLVLLDLIMPKVDGFKVLEDMKKDARLKKIPVVVLTNLGQEVDEKRCKEFGVEEFIVKADASIQEVMLKIKGYLK
ncbi:MAG: response regulator [Patescibacteria group bacterium]